MLRTTWTCCHCDNDIEYGKVHCKMCNTVNWYCTDWKTTNKFWSESRKCFVCGKCPSLPPIYQKIRIEGEYCYCSTCTRKLNGIYYNCPSCEVPIGVQRWEQWNQDNQPGTSVCSRCDNLLTDRELSNESIKEDEHFETLPAEDVIKDESIQVHRINNIEPVASPRNIRKQIERMSPQSALITDSSNNFRDSIPPVCFTFSPLKICDSYDTEDDLISPGVGECNDFDSFLPQSEIPDR